MGLLQPMCVDGMMSVHGAPLGVHCRCASMRSGRSDARRSPLVREPDSSRNNSIRAGRTAYGSVSMRARIDPITKRYPQCASPRNISSRLSRTGAPMSHWHSRAESLHCPRSTKPGHSSMSRRARKGKRRHSPRNSYRDLYHMPIRVTTSEAQRIFECP